MEVSRHVKGGATPTLKRYDGVAFDGTAGRRCDDVAACRHGGHCGEMAASDDMTILAGMVIWLGGMAGRKYGAMCDGMQPVFEGG